MRPYGYRVTDNETCKTIISNTPFGKPVKMRSVLESVYPDFWHMDSVERDNIRSKYGMAMKRLVDAGVFKVISYKGDCGERENTYVRIEGD